MINFKTAVVATQAKYADKNVKIKVLEVGDDIALLETGGNMKPRGVAGTALLYKILGAAAAQGSNLDEVHALGEKVLKSMFTFGVSMDSCSLPGKPKSHDLGADEIEIGMGIHGEQGREKVKWMQASQLVAQLMGDLKKHYGNGKLVIMLNSLGNVTALEMSLLSNEVLKWCEQAGDTVARLIVGPVVSSLDMNGISLTVLNVTELQEALPYIDAPVTSPFWPKVCNVEANKFAPVEQKTVAQEALVDCTGKDGEWAQ